MNRAFGCLQRAFSTDAAGAVSASKQGGVFAYKKREPGFRMKMPNYSMALLRPPVGCPKNQVVLRVPMKFNKLQIANYLEEIYKVKVLKVNTLITIGKTKMYQGENYGYGRMYKLADWKKAYVTITEPFEWPDI
mmetsp:Transcript_27359/g.38702  ORF Transcript_27359/g.38702 Transcript_27359/m.38702 type:complete len:134 (-) Transcript_27359:234-635(-)|eukprot:CAMPEP_0175096882 /NCGR_PEP_ID=MMETSP0086_2-20121207/4976_1 /TAXON_ID=136419 /ORGANISM="Unknown Unknown, Strain D1" /LENGTH=133 /DNA_ID=CAMNT_0016370327 /DNA_START=113 /DNA_END=514 /DNA_ORIENTATION=+